MIDLNEKKKVNSSPSSTAKQSEIFEPLPSSTNSIHNVSENSNSENSDVRSLPVPGMDSPSGKDGHIHPDVIGGFDYFDTVFVAHQTVDVFLCMPAL